MQKEVAKLITKEQGKTLPDAEGDVLRGLQVVEQCCSLTNLLMGETLPGITKDMDLVSGKKRMITYWRRNRSLELSTRGLLVGKCALRP